MKLYHGSFGFSEEFMKFLIFFSFFCSFVLGDSICGVQSSPPSHLENSIEFTEFYRVIPNFNRFHACLVSGVGIDAVWAESVTNRLSRTRLDHVFEPWIRSLNPRRRSQKRLIRSGNHRRRSPKRQVRSLNCKIRENSNFWKNGKIII